ncbi:MAG: TonB-dependent receptor domain-containing protein [Terriglobia bacterium]
MSKRLVVILTVAAALLSMPAAYAQMVSGTIVGTISDTSGAVVPAAEITVTETSTGVKRAVTADSNGYYSVPNLPPGTYSVSASKEGFSTQVRTGVSLFVNTTDRVDITLEVGAIAQKVQVTAGLVPTLQTASATTGATITQRQAEQLPLTNNHNFQNLLNLVPGSSMAVRTHSTFQNAVNSESTYVNGNSSINNMFQIEGLNDNLRTNRNQIYIPPIEEIQEVQVSTSNYDAELGSAGGAEVNVILKSGTNQFHGEAYEYYSGNALDARSYFERGAGGQPFHSPHLVNNNYGFNVGGPIQKQKTFFFVDFWKDAMRNGEFYTFSVPTAAMRSGDFSDPALTSIFNPFTGDGTDCLPDGNAKLCGTGRQQFTGNIIPAQNLDPIAQKLLNVVPLPNANQTAPGTLKYQNNLLLSSEFVENTPAFTVKIDRYQGQKDHISGRLSFEKPTQNQPGAWGNFGGPIASGQEGTGLEKAYSSGINWDHVFSPTLLTVTRVGLTRFYNVANPTGYKENLAAELGIPGINLNDFTSGPPEICGGGFSDPMFGTFGSFPWVRANDNLDYVSNWTKIDGNNTFKWGTNIRRIRDDLYLSVFFNPRGLFTFGPGPTSLNGGPKSGFANDFASFLLDVPSSTGHDFAYGFPTYRQTDVFLYAQDKWQATPKLTLNPGIRWEYYGSPTGSFKGNLSNYDPSTNELQLAGIGSIPDNLGVVSRLHNFGPRFGAAYRLTHNSVVRAGFGISYIAPFPFDRYASNYPTTVGVGFSSLSSYGPAVLTNGTPDSLTAGFPPLPPLSSILPASGIIPVDTPFLRSGSYLAINKQIREPYVMSWNLAYERTLPGRWTMDVAYVGNRAVDVPIQYNLNAATVLGQGAAGEPLFHQYGITTPNINELFAAFRNGYDSLQVKLDHRFSKGFSVTTSYTYGKALGYMDQAGAATNGLRNYVDLRQNYARTDYDQTHIFNQSFIWKLPFGRGERFLNTGAGSKVLGGWQISGVWEFTSGFPLLFTCTSACPGFNTPGNTESPDVSGPIKKLYGIGTQPWFDTSPFSAPPPATFGNVGPYILAGPNIFNLDASLSRQFRLSERFDLVLRSEWFSATNTPQFASPNTTFGTSSFGLVTSAAGNRTIDFVAKLKF